MLKELVVLNSNGSEIIFSFKTKRFSLYGHQKVNQYLLKSNFIGKTIGESESYLLVKKYITVKRFGICCVFLHTKF